MFVCDAGVLRFALLIAGIRVAPTGARSRLCGAALDFFAAAAKKVRKESGLTPPALDVYHRLSTSPYFARQLSGPCPLRTHRLNISPASPHDSYPYLTFRRPLW
ncbi:hypothetical protein BN2476_750160 [Paraburkholderia piptadeniae]|uniref:Uncharacterized protein n=1 Tax=Paraburkholderia piptadeniae TaxID=1701573 RepID=A0A1N7STE4_9BURK|nr:hypothetical protein BN2476_750160 [Paraburkholderia piptadeniae]